MTTLDANYQQLENSSRFTSTASINANAPPASSSSAAIEHELREQRKTLVSWKSLRDLATVQLILALLLILLDTAVLVLFNEAEAIHTYFYAKLCTVATGIWVGIIALIESSLGLVAFHQIRRRKHFMVAHFVMSIISCVADCVLLWLASICLIDMRYLGGSTRYYHSSPADEYEQAYEQFQTVYVPTLALESLMIIIGLAHLVSCIVSSAYICRNWCCGPQSAIIIMYAPDETGEQKDGQANITLTSKPHQ